MSSREIKWSDSWSNQTWLGYNRGKSTAHKNVSSNSIISSHNTLENTVQQFWEVDSYGIVAKSDSSLLSLNERCALDILESTSTKLNGHYAVGFLWKEDKPHLPNNRNLAISRMKSIENKFKKNPTLAFKYKETIKYYIDKGHATKLTPEEVLNIKLFTNYVPHDAVSNVNKPNKITKLELYLMQLQNANITIK